jgi:L,D-transpeptidase YcbB
MKRNKINPFYIFPVLLLCLPVLLSCRNHKHKLKNGRWVEVTPSTIHVDTLQARKFLNDSASLAEFGKPIARFYADNEYFMAWDSVENSGGLADKFIDRLEHCDEDGLNPAEYRTDKLKELRSKISLPAGKDSARKNLDILLTTEMLRYAAEMREGLTRNRKKDFGWNINSINIPVDSLVKIVIADRNKPDPFESLLPPHAAYAKLRQALKLYRTAYKNSKWEEISGFKKLKTGDTSDAVIKVRERLSITGDYSPAQSNVFNPRIFDRNLELAVKSFQARHGIDPDGMVAGKTLAALNVSLKDRITQILVNMERWRLLPMFPPKYLLVNVPEFRLFVYDGGQVVLNMKTIVGKDYKATPVFNDNLSNIVFSPYWNIPNSITKEEILPAWRKNPFYLNDHNMEAVDGFDTGAQVIPYWRINWNNIEESDFHYRIRQRPLGDNPLGPIKFMFPNNYNVYLHGTSTPSLFNKVVRAYSHGCIRIEYPVKLAAFLLRDQPGWDDYKIDEYMNRPHEAWVKVTKTPVFILYFTCWVDDEGKMQFRNDLYNLDKTLANVMGMTL